MSASLILTYHRVAEGRDPLGQCVSPTHFEAHLDVLGRTFALVPLAEVERPSRARRVALTFDDGYACNLRVAAPLLRAATAPATFFVPSRILRDAREFWWDRLEHSHFDGAPAATTLDVAPDGRRLRVDVRTERGRLRSMKALSRRLRPLTLASIDEIVDAVERQLGGAAESARCSRHRLLDRAGVAALAADPLFELGSHAVTHVMLTALDGDGQADELARSRAELQAVAETPVEAVAFPFGTPEAVDESTVRAAADAGYGRAYVNTPGPLAGRSGRLRRPRHMVHDWSADEFSTFVERWLRDL